MEIKEKTDSEKHLEIAKDIQSTQDESWRYVEKLQYAIASGALALSITLLTITIDKGQVIHCKCLIIASWICLVASILTNFISHIVSYIVSGCAIKNIYKRVEHNIKYAPSDLNTNVINKYNWIIKMFNILSIVLLAFGVIGILRFYINMICCY